MSCSRSVREVVGEAAGWRLTEHVSYVRAPFEKPTKRSIARSSDLARCALPMKPSGVASSGQGWGKIRCADAACADSPPARPFLCTAAHYVGRIGRARRKSAAEHAKKRGGRAASQAPRKVP